MKSVAITLSTLVALVAAQDVSSLPQCGQGCATSMLNVEAPNLGCAVNDLACLCQNKDFTYGLRDCSAATCGSEEARQIVEFGIQLCRDAGVEITTGPGGDATATGTDGGAAGSVSTIFSTITGSDGSVVTTPVATTTIGGENGSNSGSATPTGTPTGSVVSTFTSDGSAVVTTLSTVTSGAGSASETATDGDATESDSSSTETGSDGGESSTTGSNGDATSTTAGGAAMPQRTIAPAAGIIAAGLAALLL